jgi:hypothetical protein
MNSRGLLISLAVIVAGASTACGGGNAASSYGTTTAAPDVDAGGFGGSGTRANVPVLVDLYGQPVIRPTRIDFGGDGGFYLTGLAWTRWAASGAAATGKAHENDCVPSCAAGHYRVYRAKITLASVKHCASGRLAFTRIRYVPTGPGSSTAYELFGDDCPRRRS